MTRITQGRLFRIVVAAAVGVVVSLAVAGLTHTVFGLMSGWIAAGLLFCAWTWTVVGRLSPAETKTHALSEDPGTAASDIILLLASLGAIVGVGFLITASGAKQTPAAASALLGVAAVVTSWCVLHTMFMLRYAREFFTTKPGGVDFNSDDDPGDGSPDYGDFAYLAFTIGMCYQVSDTTFTNKTMRHTGMRHALLSFMLGAIVLACTINLVSQLASTA